MYYCHQLFFFVKLTYSSNRKSQDWFWKHWCSKAKRMLFFLESHCKCWSNATKSLFSTEDLKHTLLSYPVGAATAAAAACRSQSSWATRIQIFLDAFGIWPKLRSEAYSTQYSCRCRHCCCCRLPLTVMLKCHLDTKIMAYAQMFWQGNSLKYVRKKVGDISIFGTKLKSPEKQRIWCNDVIYLTNLRWQVLFIIKIKSNISIICYWGSQIELERALIKEAFSTSEQSFSSHQQRSFVCLWCTRVSQVNHPTTW